MTRLSRPHKLWLHAKCFICFTVLILPLVLSSCASSSSVSESQKGDALAEVIKRANELNLADVRSVIPDIVIDLPYATTKNVTHQVLYPANMPCLLLRPTAEKLRMAQELLRAQGYGLKIWDAWRPTEVQLALYHHGGETGIFANPNIGWSFHCIGTAVDVTLVDLDGKELEMQTGYDAIGPKAHYLSTHKTDEVRKRIHALQTAMRQAGFGIIDAEWWHFEDVNYRFPPQPYAVSASALRLKLPKMAGGS